MLSALVVRWDGLRSHHSCIPELVPTLFVHGFCLLLPIGLVDSLTIFTPLASTAVGFTLLAMDRIGAVYRIPLKIEPTMCL